MLTLFSIPRAFEGHANTIQCNAIESWLRTNAQCEVILCGNDDGVASAAQALGVRHLPDVATTPYGTPYFDAALSTVLHHTHNPMICFINSDIVLVDDLLQCLRPIAFPEFLVIGQRLNMDIHMPMDFLNERWRQNLKSQAMHTGAPGNHWGMDYFIFPRHCCITDMPPLIVGRNFFDNWIVWRAWELDIPIIDASRAICAVHQNHDYQHVPGGTHEQPGAGPESDANAAVVGHRIGNRYDAGFQLSGRGVHRIWSARHMQRRVVRQLLRWNPKLVARLVRVKHRLSRLNLYE